MAMMVLALLGCVPKQQHVELQGRFDAAQVELAAREADIGALEQQVQELTARVEALRRDVAAKESALDELRQRNAEALADKGALNAQIGEMREALAELERRKAAADARLAEFQDLLKRFKALIDAGTLEVKIKDGRMLVAMATDVLFASGSADLSRDGKQALAEVAAILASIPGRTFQVEGHTDDDPIRTARFPDNWYLASARAINVVAHMLESGMPPERISGASFGEHRPVVPNDSKENKALNRRIEIVVVPDLSELPGYEELQALQ